MASIGTDVNGVITVTVAATGINAEVNGKKIELRPYQTAAGLKTVASNMGSAVFRWGCGPAASPNGVPIKYLPATCRE